MITGRRTESDAGKKLIPRRENMGVTLSDDFHGGNCHGRNGQ